MALYLNGEVGCVLGWFRLEVVDSEIPVHFCAYPKPGSGFPTSYVVVFFFFFINKLRCEVIVCFVDIGGIVDYLCLKLSIHNVVENFHCYIGVHVVAI